MKKTTLLGLTLAGATLLGTDLTVKADEIFEDGQRYHEVESGETMSAIAEKYNMNMFDIFNMNTHQVSDINLIYVGQKLILDGEPIVVNEEEPYVEEYSDDYTETVYYETYTEEPSVDYSTGGGNNDNWHKANRRQVENSGSYEWSGYYIGAYQFDPGTWASTAAAHGLDPNDYSPANQDAMADAYANDRWGGWSNVPTTGGW